MRRPSTQVAERAAGTERRSVRPAQWLRPGLPVAVLATIAALVLALHPRELLTAGQIGRLPPLWAAAAFVAVFACATLALLPKPLLNAAAGALFGLPEGLPLAVLGSVLGAALAFALARRLGRDAIRPRLRFKAWAALDRRLSGQGFRTVVMLRLVPGVPAPAVNFAAAFSGMPVRSFLAGTAIGTLPASAPYVAAGSAAASPSAPALWGAAAALLLLAGWSAARLLTARRKATARRATARLSPATAPATTPA
jgi:uncharacterized membrane protein YdjX (TVP38/TMEM64 family)